MDKFCLLNKHSTYQGMKYVWDILDLVSSHELVDMEAIHFLLTWLWIFLGYLAQFVMVCRHIKAQDYLPAAFKFFIVLSSLFMLGPTMIHIYCIGHSANEGKIRQPYIFITCSTFEFYQIKVYFVLFSFIILR